MKDLDFLAGEVLLFDKPMEWTSFDVVKKIRYELKKKLGVKKIKVGHAGTLDPLATGLLILCTGKKTKTIASIQEQEKTYEGTFYLGATTPSYDLETEVNATFDKTHISKKQIQEVTDAFIGEHLQSPPIFSAKKIDGKRAYEFARKGEERKMKKSLIQLYDFATDPTNFPEVEFKVRCSKGTYIRSLAYDFGLALNSGAYLKSLRRTQIGEHEVADAYSISRFIEELEYLEVPE